MALRSRRVGPYHCANLGGAGNLQRGGACGAGRKAGYAGRRRRRRRRRSAGWRVGAPGPGGLGAPRGYLGARGPGRRWSRADPALAARIRPWETPRWRQRERGRRSRAPQSGAGLRGCPLRAAGLGTWSSELQRPSQTLTACAPGAGRVGEGGVQAADSGSSPWALGSSFRARCQARAPGCSARAGARLVRFPVPALGLGTAALRALVAGLSLSPGLRGARLGRRRLGSSAPAWIRLLGRGSGLGLGLVSYVPRCRHLGSGFHPSCGCGPSPGSCAPPAPGLGSALLRMRLLRSAGPSSRTRARLLCFPAPVLGFQFHLGLRLLRSGVPGFRGLVA
ncbi:elastin-like [Sarcophilus harrisii]|uniref:elastin-like n=1 Tax=Sarcophilus harrisii TaxID=9305 RepID=UPI001301CB41|nr:elastin-like [Sarcophilus harrisii]